MGRISTGKGGKILGRKRGKIWKGLRGKGERISTGKGGKGQRILGRNREKISAGGKALFQQGKGGKDLREERSQGGKKP